MGLSALVEPSERFYHALMASGNGRSPVTQADLRELEARLRQDLGEKIFKNNERMDRLEGNLTAEMRLGFRDMNGKIDAFLSKIETYGRESATLPRTLDDHGKILKEHDKRLTALEART